MRFNKKTKTDYAMTKLTTWLWWKQNSKKQPKIHWSELLVPYSASYHLHSEELNISKYTETTKKSQQWKSIELTSKRRFSVQVVTEHRAEAAVACTTATNYYADRKNVTIRADDACVVSGWKFWIVGAFIGCFT